jgi:hypothetical protein
MVSLMQFYQNTVLFPAKGSNAPAGSYGGTSCVAPLYAGLAAVIQSAFGFSPGFLSPLFYQLGVSANSPFNTITAPGNNSSGNGAPFFLGGNTGKVGNTTWDPCSGWGSINGEKLLNGLAGLLFPQEVYIVADKNTFSLDEVKDQLTWQSAFWVVLQGFTPKATEGAEVLLYGAFSGLSNITLSPQLRFLEMPGNPDTPQQIWYPYNITFKPGSITGGTFPTSGSATYPLGASVDINSPTVANPAPSQPAEFTLLEGNNPYFTNVGLQANGQLNQNYLSQDLRVFTITPGLIDPTTNQPYPQLGDSAITATLSTASPTSYDPQAPFTYITQLLQQLNAPNLKYILPTPQGQPDPLDTLLPGQANAYQDFSSTTPSTVNSNGNVYMNYSFESRVSDFLKGPVTPQIIRSVCCFDYSRRSISTRTTTAHPAHLELWGQCIVIYQTRQITLSSHFQGVTATSLMEQRSIPSHFMQPVTSRLLLCNMIMMFRALPTLAPSTRNRLQTTQVPTKFMHTTDAISTCTIHRSRFIKRQ